MEGQATLSDYLFNDSLANVDPHLCMAIEREEERQDQKLILIPSESICPRPVREALGSVFTSIYAEGYPSTRTLLEDLDRSLDIEEQLALHRRYSDRRFYKGTELASLVEVIAQKRAARLFATDSRADAEVKIKPEEIFVNVQALSGAAANNAVYEALVQPGDTIMGLDLTHGGHLTHGSPYNRSGRYHKVVSYGVNQRTGRLDYDEIARQAAECRPRIIVAGATAYPWDIDWRRLREIADAVPGRSWLLADISHPAGLVAAGLFPNPVGYADVVTFTTHKTLLGPRAAVILSTDPEVARAIDRAVFPGEQGGPHVNNIAAMAVAFAIAGTEAFRQIQAQIVANAQALAAALTEAGLTLSGGGTNTHLLLIDLNAIPSPTGSPLKGDVASRVLDICGLVCNKNTIPGDLNAAYSSAIRLGTVWATQRGMREAHMGRVAQIIHQVLTSIKPFRYYGPVGDLGRGKIELEVLEWARAEVARLLAEVSTSTGRPLPPSTASPSGCFEIGGPRARAFLQQVGTAHILDLAPGQGRQTLLLDPDGNEIAKAHIRRLEDDRWSRPRYALKVDQTVAARVKSWLESLSDGYVLFDRDDLYAKVEGPVVITDAPSTSAEAEAGADTLVDTSKPYFVGQHRYRTNEAHQDAKPEFHPQGYEGPARRTCLYEEHLKLTAARNLIPFAGWTLPVWYSSIGEEHRAVRTTAGLFDVSHMGVLEVSGPGACRFLDLVTTNYVPALNPGQAQYSYLLDPDGTPIDDIFVYCRGLDRYMVVVNAANAERVEAWLRAVSSRQCLIDRDHPGATVDATAAIRNLKDPACGPDQRVDLALQGPASLAILQSLSPDRALQRRLGVLPKSSFLEGQLAGIDVIIARTGYTGEEIGFEIYVHPEHAPALWQLLLERGAQYGIKPAGLGARDSTRIEAGFPLYGHELAGEYNISPAGAGYGAFVKLHKPFFIGRKAFIEQDATRTKEIIRFRMRDKGIRMLRSGDPIATRRGRCIGHVTSCTAVEGVQIGLAYVERGAVSEGSPIVAFPLPRGRQADEKPKALLQAGDPVLLPEEGEVISRFMVKKEQA